MPSSPAASRKKKTFRPGIVPGKVNIGDNKALTSVIEAIVTEISHRLTIQVLYPELSSDKRNRRTFPVIENTFPDTGAEFPCSCRSGLARNGEKNGLFSTPSHKFPLIFAFFPCISADF